MSYLCRKVHEATGTAEDLPPASPPAADGGGTGVADAAAPPFASVASAASAAGLASPSSGAGAGKAEFGSPVSSVTSVDNLSVDC